MVMAYKIVDKTANAKHDDFFKLQQTQTPEAVEASFLTERHVPSLGNTFCKPSGLWQWVRTPDQAQPTTYFCSRF